MPTEQTMIISSQPAVGIKVITIDRRERRNAVDRATAKALYDSIIEFENDPDAKVAILNGAHGTFCAGFDLHTVETEASGESYHLTPTADRTIGPMGPSRLQVRKPLLCAVSGHAVAGGLELSLLADMRIVEEDAIFGVFCRRWGVPLIDGGTVRLQAFVGLGRALDMILTGRPVDAQEALSIGLANRVVPKGKALETAVEVAKQLLQYPQLCMNLDRNSCYYACYEAASFQQALTYEYRNGIAAVRKEGVAGASKFSSGSGRHGTPSL